MDPFLTRDEKRTVQKMYDKWNKHAKADILLESLIVHGMLHEREIEEIRAKQTMYDKNKYLYDAVLSRSTYDRISKVRDILCDLDDDTHSVLADMLPKRAPVNLQQEQHTDYGSGYSGPQTGGSQPSQYQAPPNDNYDPKYAYGHKPRSNSFEQASSRPDPGTKQQAPPRSEGENRNTNVVRKNGKLEEYPTRPNNPESGKGLCVIIANFTDELQGYNNDITSITEFFGKTLGYTVLGGNNNVTDAIGYRDLTADKCREKMTWLKTELENGRYKTCDRFFLFVLSHGDDFGIKMMPLKNKDNIFKDNILRDRIKSEYLVETFAHGQLPNLKSYPKCFFIQVCSGTDIAEAAHGSPMDLEEETRSPVVAVGADTLVCHAAKEGKYSWVSQGPSGGSWFLQATLAVFKEHHKEEHILDMLTEVNRCVSEKHGLAKVSGKPDAQKVFQLPAISNNLTKKLYLKK